MVDTVRTDAAALALLPLNIVGAINPQDLRDAVVTAYAKGGYTPEQYGAVAGTVSGSVRTANATAFNDMIAAAHAAGKPCVIPGGNYEIAGTIDATGLDGIRIIGAGANATTITEYTDNIPILKVGDPTGGGTTHRSVVVQRLALAYANLQTGNASAVALWLGHLFQSTFSHLRLDNGYDLISNAASDLSVFNCSFDNLDLFNWIGYALHIKRSAGVSGNNYSNIYCGTSSAGVSSHSNARDVTGAVRITDAGQGSVNQLNIEWCRPSDAALILTGTEEIVANGINFEGVSCRGGKGLIFVQDSNSVLNGVTVNNCRFRDTDGCTKAAISVMGDRGCIDITSLRVLTTTLSGLTAYVFQSDDLSAGNVDATCKIGLFKPKSGHSISGIANTLVAGASNTKRHPLVDVGATGTTGNVHTVGDGNVTAKAELHSTRIMVNVPISQARTLTLSQYMNSGDSILAPNGATKIIWRDAAATGAFNYNVNNHDATLIQALVAAGNWVEVIFDGANWRKVRAG